MGTCIRDIGKLLKAESKARAARVEIRSAGDPVSSMQRQADLAMAIFEQCAAEAIASPGNLQRLDKAIAMAREARKTVAALYVMTYGPHKVLPSTSTMEITPEQD
jgi:hypothetical protein